MTCSNCSTQSTTGDRFCRECGTSLPTSASSRPAPLANGLSTTVTLSEHDIRVEPLLERARELLDQGDDDGALIAAQAATSVHPDAAAVHALLGRIYERKGDYKKSLHHYELLLAADPYAAGLRDKIDLLRDHAATAPAGVKPGRSPWVLAGSAAGGLVLLVGAAVLLSNPGAARSRHDPPIKFAPYGSAASLAPANAGTPKLNPTPLTPGSSAASTTQPGAATATTGAAPSPAPLLRVAPSISPAPAPVANRTAPTLPSSKNFGTDDTPRIGLPRVVGPGEAKGTAGIAPAAVGQVVPAPIQPGQGTDPRLQGTGATAQPQNPSTNRVEAPAQPRNTAGPEVRNSSGRKVEPIEPDTGFIRIKRVPKPEAAPAPAPQPENGGNGINITLPNGRRGQ